MIHEQGGIEEATRKYGPKAERLSKWKAMKSVAKVTNKASRVASFMVMWAVAMLDEGVEEYTITQYQRYWSEGERQVYRLQREFRELWPEFETPNEFAAQMKGQLDPSMSRVDVAMPYSAAGDGVMGVVVAFRRRPGSEPWLSKRQIAEHFGYSTRWVEMLVREGMPSEMLGGHRRFLAGECEQWLLKGRSA